MPSTTHSNSTPRLPAAVYATARGGWRRGFSIIELIVVIVLLGIIGTIVAPRLSSLGGKQARADAQALAELLSIAARRDDLTSQPVAIEFDAQRESVEMLAFAPPSSNDGPPVWRADRLAPAAELRGTVIVTAQADGNELDARHWRIEFSQNSRRPSLFILLRDPLHGDEWHVELAAGSTRATIAPGDAPAGMSDGAIDLDAAGRSEEAW